MLPELWVKTTEFLNGKDITILSLISKNLNFIVNNIIKKIRFKGFPRKEGKCMVYEITSEVISYDINFFSRYCYSHNYDCVRGDVICINPVNLICIFDGIKLLPMIMHDQYPKITYILPKELAFIDHSIPLDYYYRSSVALRDIYKIDMQLMVPDYLWIDNKLIMDNCVELGYAENHAFPGHDRRYVKFKLKDKIYNVINYDPKLIHNDLLLLCNYYITNKGYDYHVYDFDLYKKSCCSLI